MGRERKLQECQVKDMQSRLDDAEVDAEARRMADATKNLKASERHIKEISLKQSEDAENKAKMDKLIDSLNGKIESYKKQLKRQKKLLLRTLPSTARLNQRW